MGGLAVDVSDVDDRLHSVALTPAGLQLLAERGHFIEVSDDDIRDKSKANIFAKCLVIFQVSWMAMQTISRKGYRLSIVTSRDPHSCPRGMCFGHVSTLVSKTFGCTGAYHCVESRL